jgi:predicted RNase H-like nuclease (RuvC/YqgF family)
MTITIATATTITIATATAIAYVFYSQGEISDMKNRLEISTMSGGEVTKKYEDIVNTLEQENSLLKTNLSEKTSTLSREQEKLKSLQDSLNNLESGHADRARHEQEAAEERARQMQQLEMDHITEVRGLENKIAENKANFQVYNFT